MKKLQNGRLVAWVAVVCVCLAAWGNGAAVTKVEKTKVVPRCQAVFADGTQCSNTVGDGECFCWRHHGVTRAVGESAHQVGDGMTQAASATRTWATNAWAGTKSGAASAWDATKQTMGEIKDGIRDFLVGNDGVAQPTNAADASPAGKGAK